jgi:uncharacterized protein (UPF0333 family)
MCWKQEWANAIGNIESAIRHIERAQQKLERRREKNLATMLKHKGKWTIKTVAPLLVRNTVAIEECKQTASRLKGEQALIYAMIKAFGISNRPHSKRLVENMAGYRPGRTR